MQLRKRCLLGFAIALIAGLTSLTFAQNSVDCDERMTYHPRMKRCSLGSHSSRPHLRTWEPTASRTRLHLRPFLRAICTRLHSGSVAVEKAKADL